MLTRLQPCAAYDCDSARVENRGPSITTIAPPRLMSGSAAATAVESRSQYGSANGACTAPRST